MVKPTLPLAENSLRYGANMRGLSVAGPWQPRAKGIGRALVANAPVRGRG
ncbi:hypothetical protein GCM10023100_67570 [Actinocorallia cavernae]|uniref:Uncharacterized protein n=2 Tax=Actinomycetes TaxID=1760 RepID=A0ABP8T7E1_9ACTN